jgi:NADH pyrophosphatase NudC (nudix superfamily)
MPASSSHPHRRQVRDLLEAIPHDTSLAPSTDRLAPQTTQSCPRCGHSMPNLKGGTGSICSVCGFKDSCCY